MPFWRAKPSADTDEPRPNPDLDAVELLASSVCILDNVRITSVLTLDDEILVGIWGCGGTWFAPEDGRSNRLGIVRDPGWLETSVAFAIPWPHARHRAMEMFARWQQQGTALHAFVSVQQELVGIVDLASDTVFAAELPDHWMGRSPKAGADLAP